MKIKAPLRQPLALLGLLAATFLALACTSEVVKEVPVEKVVQVVVTATPGPTPALEVRERTVVATPTLPSPTATPAAVATPSEPKVYQLGIFEDLTTTNYFAYLGTDTTIWNSYVLGGGQPAYL